MLTPLPFLFLENERFEASVRFFVINEPPNTRRHNSKVQMKAFGSNVKLVHSIAACHTHTHTHETVVDTSSEKFRTKTKEACVRIASCCAPGAGQDASNQINDSSNIITIKTNTNLPWE